MKLQNFPGTKAILALMLLTFGAAANATLYTYSVDNPPGSASAGEITHVTTSYDTNSSELFWSYTIKKTDNGRSDGFWLVLSPGENPKGNVNEYAILYGDTDNNRLTAYEYNGKNASNSWSTPGNLLQSIDGLLNVVDTADERTVSFTLDAGFINDANNHAKLKDPQAWLGTQFANFLGLWFHPTLGTSVSYAQDGSITGFGAKRAGWYDTSFRIPTQEVPEPQGIVLLGLGFAGLVFLRRPHRKGRRTGGKTGAAAQA